MCVFSNYISRAPSSEISEVKQLEFLPGRQQGYPEKPFLSAQSSKIRTWRDIKTQTCKRSLKKTRAWACTSELLRFEIHLCRVWLLFHKAAAAASAESLSSKLLLMDSKQIFVIFVRGSDGFDVGLLCRINVRTPSSSCGVIVEPSPALREPLML